MATYKAFAIAVATLGMAVSGSTSALASQRRAVGAEVLVPGNGGYLYCTVKVSSSQPINLTVILLDEQGREVPTEFGSSLVTSPSGSDNLYRAEATAGAFNDSRSRVTGSCKALAEGRYLRDVPNVEVKAYYANGEEAAQ